MKASEFESGAAILKGYVVPGAAIATIGDSELLTKSYIGRVDKKGSPVTNSTVFQMGSISKSVTAWGVMQLVQEKVLDLDAPVSKYLTQVGLNNYSKEITVRMLMSHTSGLPSLFYLGQTMRSYKNTKSNNPICKNILYEPGSRYSYTGLGYYLIQQIIEHILEMPFAKVMSERVLKPLKMLKSSFEWSEPVEKVISRPYNYLGREMKHLYYRESAAAGLYSTLDDMVRFTQANLGVHQNVLCEESIRIMHTRYHRMVPYGIGFQIGTIEGQKVIWHTGRNRGWSSAILFIPARKSGVVCLTNSDNGQNFNALIIEQFALEQGFTKDKIRQLTGLSPRKSIHIFRDDLLQFLKQWIKKH